MTTQHPIPPSLDLRDMLRQHLITRSLRCMEASAARRKRARESGEIAAYQREVRQTVTGFYGRLPAGADCPAPEVTPVSAFDKKGYRIENVLFASFPGWQVNASVYIPLDFAPPYPAVVIPVGHSGKQFASYQLPAQAFARSGYLAVLFDPPGQAGEKQSGNDHFSDGVRCYLVGETSSRYFVADALRCVDYVYSRSDVDTTRGVAMTGVSGGGTTTLLASALDDRITVIGPSCCLSSRAELDIRQAYAGCPETAMFGRYAALIDETDFLCAVAPKPTLLMAGEQDEVFRIADTRALAVEVAAFFDGLGKAENFAFFVDAGGHAYTLMQAREFVAFMDRHLRRDAPRSVLAYPDADFALDPYDALRCYPRQDVNTRTLTLARAEALKAERTPLDANRIRDLVMGQDAAPQTPTAIEGAPFRVWTHHWQQILLKPERGIELPATFVYGAARPTRAILHFDDQHRDRLLESHGPLMRALGFLEGREEDSRYSLLSIDARGWGDSCPALYPYELAAWGSVDRFMAYISAALGDSLLAQRVRDGLAALLYLQSRPEIDPGSIVISGCGLGGLVALHVAALASSVGGVVIWDTLVSFQSLLEAERHAWPAEAFLPNVLQHYDLPELVSALPCPVSVVRPRDAMGEALAEVEGLSALAGRKVYTNSGDAAEAIRALLDSASEGP